MVLVTYEQTPPQLQCKMFCSLTTVTGSWKRVFACFLLWFGLCFLVVVDWLVGFSIVKQSGETGAFPLKEAGVSHCNSAAAKAVTFNQFWPCSYSFMGAWWSFYIFVFLLSCSSFSNFHEPYCSSGGGWRLMFKRIWKEDWCSRLLLWTTTLIPPYCWRCQCSTSCFQE